MVRLEFIVQKSPRAKLPPLVHLSGSSAQLTKTDWTVWETPKPSAQKQPGDGGGIFSNAKALQIRKLAATDTRVMINRTAARAKQPLLTRKSAFSFILLFDKLRGKLSGLPICPNILVLVKNFVWGGSNPLRYKSKRFPGWSSTALWSSVLSTCIVSPVVGAALMCALPNLVGVSRSLGARQTRPYLVFHGEKTDLISRFPRDITKVNFSDEGIVCVDVGKNLDRLRYAHTNRSWANCLMLEQRSCRDEGPSKYFSCTNPIACTVIVANIHPQYPSPPPPPLIKTECLTKERNTHAQSDTIFPRMGVKFISCRGNSSMPSSCYWTRVCWCKLIVVTLLVTKMKFVENPAKLSSVTGVGWNLLWNTRGATPILIISFIRSKPRLKVVQSEVQYLFVLVVLLQFVLVMLTVRFL